MAVWTKGAPFALSLILFVLLGSLFIPSVAFNSHLYITTLWSTRPNELRIGSDRGRQFVSVAMERTRVGVHMDSPSAQRNKDPIWKVLSSSVLTKLEESRPSLSSFRVLEVAAGVGVHTEYFVEQFRTQFPGTTLEWVASDPDESCRATIASRMEGVSVRALTLGEDGFVEQEGEGEGDDHSQSYDLMVCINMIHISPWEATVGLMKEASRQLSRNGRLYCYGPYLFQGTGAASNLQFDQSLKSRNPLWGVRNVEDVVKVAEENNLTLVEQIDMPKDNLSLIFCRS